MWFPPLLFLCLFLTAKPTNSARVIATFLGRDCLSLGPGRAVDSVWQDGCSSDYSGKASYFLFQFSPCKDSFEGKAGSLEELRSERKKERQKETKREMCRL